MSYFEQVSLDSGTITALTPPTAAAIGTAVSTDLLIGTQVAGSSLPVALPTSTITAITPPTAAAIASAIVANPPTVVVTQGIAADLLATVSIASAQTLATVTTVDTVNAVTSITDSVTIVGPIQIGNAPTSVNVGISSASVLSSNSSRTGLVLINLSANMISLGFGSNAAVLYSGITLYPGASVSMDILDGCQQEINAIASSASSNLAIQEIQ